MIGVRQSCIISPMLFLLTIDFVMHHSTSGPHQGIPWNTSHLTDLDFADDLALLGETAKPLHSMTDNLRTSTEKTKVMSVREHQSMALKVNQQEAEEVNNFTYRGSRILNKGATEWDISCRQGEAASIFQKHSCIWTRPN